MKRNGETQRCTKAQGARALRLRPSVARIRDYEAPEEGREGKLRLDFNENTVGCSPAVLRALSQMTPEQLAMYPEYEKSTRRLAAFSACGRRRCC